MSFHYEFVISTFLRDDTPSGTLDELRWHMGLSEHRPQECTIDYADPQLRASPEEHILPGGEWATLERQFRYTRGGVDTYQWALYLRLYWLDDTWAEIGWQVAKWLADYAISDGYAGFCREEDETYPTLVLFKDRKAHMCEFGGEPVAIT